MSDPRTQEAVTLMEKFAERTGLTSGKPPRRYLWTDAFAVCNYLGLARITGEERYQELALRLVEQVHRTLGRYRDDEQRSGWISGLDEKQGQRHPTRGGLRIGKAMPERGPDEPYNERLEWDRDGQYFHYLTKWMHALDQVSRVTRHARFNQWARELAATAQQAFSYLPAGADGPRRMYWKMSIDLSRPLVPSMGQHDPLDGYITYTQLSATAVLFDRESRNLMLEDERRQTLEMIQGGEWATADPLGIGGLLVDAYRVYQLKEESIELDPSLLENLLEAAHSGVRYYVGQGELVLPAQHRLAFRELGLAIGLQAVERMKRALGKANNGFPAGAPVRKVLDALLEYKRLADEIEIFWRHPDHQRSATWLEHQDINEVMLSTYLVPRGFLVLSDGK